MLIECIANDTSLINYWPITASPLESLLNVGTIYQVYGLYLGETVFYEILLTEYDDHTIEFPSFLFKVIDNRLSSFFALGSSERLKVQGSENREKVHFVTFPEWANDNTFFDKLIDGDKEVQAIFDRYKELIFLEYKHSSITEVVTKITGYLVQCPICSEAWELPSPNFEMCRCPNCKTVLLVDNMLDGNVSD
jgi:hypothetical protein